MTRHTRAPETKRLARENAENHRRKNITLKDYMLIVYITVGRRSDPKDRRDTSLASIRIQRILRPRPQRTVSLSVELVNFFFFSALYYVATEDSLLLLKCKYPYKFM